MSLPTSCLYLGAVWVLLSMASRINCEVSEVKLGDPVARWEPPMRCMKLPVAQPMQTPCGFIQQRDSPSPESPQGQEHPCPAAQPSWPSTEGRSLGSGHWMDPGADSDLLCLHLVAGLDSALSTPCLDSAFSKGFSLCINLPRVPKSWGVYQRWEQINVDLCHLWAKEWTLEHRQECWYAFSYTAL